MSGVIALTIALIQTSRSRTFTQRIFTGSSYLIDTLKTRQQRRLKEGKTML